MSNRTTFPVEGNFHRPTFYAVSWAPNGAAAIDQALVRGNSRVSVLRTGAGQYTLTFNDKMPELVYANARILSDTTTAAAGQAISIGLYNQAAKSIVVTVVDQATMATGQNTLTNTSRICCEFLFKNSSSKH